MAKTMTRKPKKKAVAEKFDIIIDCDNSYDSRDLVRDLILYGYNVKVIRSAVVDPVARYGGRTYSGLNRIRIEFFLGRKSLVDLAFGS